MNDIRKDKELLNREAPFFISGVDEAKKAIWVFLDFGISQEKEGTVYPYLFFLNQ